MRPVWRHSLKPPYILDETSLNCPKFNWEWHSIWNPSQLQWRWNIICLKIGCRGDLLRKSCFSLVELESNWMALPVDGCRTTHSLQNQKNNIMGLKGFLHIKYLIMSFCLFKHLTLNWLLILAQRHSRCLTIQSCYKSECRDAYSFFSLVFRNPKLVKWGNQWDFAVVNWLKRGIFQFRLGKNPELAVYHSDK